MGSWTPNLEMVASQLPVGSEDVAFKDSLTGATVVKAHAIVLAKQSKVFADQFYPLIEGQSFPIVVMDWTRTSVHDMALKSFVRMLHGTGPDPATLDMKVLIGLHRLSKHYQISGLEADMLASIQSFQISLDSLPHYMTEVLAESTYANPGLLECDEKEAVKSCIEKAINDIPGKDLVLGMDINLDPLREQLARSFPTGTDIENVLDAYKKFLALKV